MNWNELREEVKSLASKIDYTPDVIIGIVRGGLIPARLLSSELRVKDMYAITVKKVGDERRVMNDILEELSAKNVLLVEDMLETGKSLLVAKEYLEEKGARIKTACLYTMPISELRPDFWLKEVSEVVPFPWE
ncbi:MAG TPA: phosphoribosyltransferase family protein [Candidatus Paceibacterota bacterium]